MKTEQHIDAAPAVASTPSLSHTLLLTLLERQQHQNLSNPVNGLTTGTLCHLDDTGIAQVQPDHMQEGPFTAISMIALSQEDVGSSRFVLGFQGCDPSQPIILGRIWTPSAEASPATKSRSAQPEPNQHSPRKMVVQADEELELQCGQALIVLQADGNIQVRGRNITQHADALHRIRGGAVHLN